MARRRMILAALAAAAVLAAAGIAFGALGKHEGPAVPATQAATRLEALFDAAPGAAVPSERARREVGGGAAMTWRRLPAIEREADLAEFDVARTRDGGICIFEMEYGDLHPAASGCVATLKSGGDLQTMVGKSLGQPELVVGIASDRVVRVTVHSADGDSPAQLQDDIVTWRAPAPDPALEPTGATIDLTDGSEIDVDSGMAVQ